MFHKIKLFLQESRKELMRVNWPTREETMRLTGIVIVISVALASFLGVFDFLFLEGVKMIVQGDNNPTNAAPLESANLPNFEVGGVGATGDVDVTTVPPAEPMQ
ncbi:MAG: preprotein translocase subunit SecE [Candidatus Liptonbacteria bacterium]|nr:preprotein translocase subunit SecE [Candidatus Liptonbacteria bacterium]